MVLFTPEKLTFKGSKKQHQILAQTAYYQAGKIVVQTILPEQPPVALITLNTLGTTCSTSADTYIPIENIFNTQSCSSLESRLVSLYGGKAASLLIEYEQRLRFLFLNKNNDSSFNDSFNDSSIPIRRKAALYPVQSFAYKSLICKAKGIQSKTLQRKSLPLDPKKGKGYGVEALSGYNRGVVLTSYMQSQIFDFPELTLLPNKKGKPNGKARLVRTCFAGAGNNIFQSTLGTIEIQTATRLARIMVNYWNFYSLNKISLYSLFKNKKYAPAKVPLYRKEAINSINKLTNFNDSFNDSFNDDSNDSSTNSSNDSFRQIEDLLQSTPYTLKGEAKRSLALPENFNLKVKDMELKDLFYILKEESVAKKLEVEGYAKRKCNVRVWGVKLKVKDKTPQGNIIYQEKNKYKVVKRWNNLYFAIAQSKNSLKICENKNSSYKIQQLSIKNIGNYSQLNTNNFQLINSLQFSHLQRDRFYPNWFRLYLPDMEATEFLKNIPNYYFSLSLQTLTFPSTKFSYSQALGKLKVSTESPFLTFLNKNTQKKKYKLFSPNISSYTYCPPSKFYAQCKATLCKGTPYPFTHYPVQSKALLCKGYAKRSFALGMELKPFAKQSFTGHTQLESLSRNNLTSYDKLTSYNKFSINIKNPNFKKITKDQLDPLNVPFSLLLENQIFPLNHNGFSIVEKELLYNALVNSSFTKAFYLINQNRQLLDFFVDYLLRFQILRQHQILYLFSTLLLGCNKTV